MKIFILMSWRNLWRHKRRSLVVISSIGLGIFAMIFSMGFMNGMNTQMIENTISTSLGHVAIHRAGYNDNMKLELNFEAGEKLYQTIKANKSVTSFAPRVKMEGMARSSEASRSVLVVGIDPEMEKKVTSLYSYTSKKDGSEFLDSRTGNDILISKTMAKTLDLGFGDKLVLMIQDNKSEISSAAMTVKGIYASPVDSFDKFFVFIGIEKLQKITGIGKNISEITIITEDKDNVNGVKKSLVGAISDSSLEVLTWEDMAPSLVRAVKLFDQMMVVFFSIVFITVIFSVANTLIMAIMERFHEIGVMKCIGTRPKSISFMIIFEAINLGAVGLVLGIGLGLLLIFILQITGIDLSFYMESMRAWGTGGVIYPVIKLFDIVLAVTIVFITTVIAAIYPAIKAARIKPLEALNYI
ncbi:MAG: ABC transporter permease [bacterium]|nr:ABC transporter permease [bacterium]